MTIPALTDCDHGYEATAFCVLIAVEQLEEKTKGGIILPDAKKETDEMASVRGRIVSVSPLAFSYETWPEGSRQPQLGDAVIFAKYGGTLVTGRDGKEYRVLNDRDIMLVMPEEW